MKFTYKILFSDVDFAQVIFFARAYYVAQQFQEELFNAYGIYYKHLIKDLDFDLAIVESACRFLAPVTLDDVLTIEVGIKDFNEKGLTCIFNFYKGDQVALSGYIKQRFIDFTNFKGTTLLPELRDSFERMEAENNQIELHMRK